MTNHEPTEYYSGTATFRNNDTGYEWTESHGPYANAGVVQSQFTRNLRWRRDSTLIETHIRKGTVIWEDYDMAANKKERAKQVRLEKKLKTEAKIKAANDAFWEELND